MRSLLLTVVFPTLKNARMVLVDISSRSPSDPSSISVTLLARVKNNDAEAWARLVSLYSPLVDVGLADGALLMVPGSHRLSSSDIGVGKPGDLNCNGTVKQYTALRS